MKLPKEAIKEAIAWWPVDGDDKILADLLAAIPITELHEQAVELLKRYGVFVGIHHGSKDYLKWRNERVRLLAQLKALK